MSSLSKSPRRIRLKEVPEEGREYEYSHLSKELNESLKDLIGDSEYQVNLHVQPLGNAYELRGRVQCSMALLCSRCGIDIRHPVDERFTEILMVNQDASQRTEKAARVNHASELNPEGPNYSLLPNDVFEVPDFIHEIIALAEPVQPLGQESCKISCPNLEKAYAEGWLKDSSETASAGEQKNSPFAVLKDLKLKN